MILDSAVEAMPARLAAQVVIVGAGAAGITLARVLGAAGVDVVVLESGADQVTPEAQALGDAEMTGNDAYPLAASRVRALGGTTAAWTGFCHPLDPVDLTARDWIDPHGWPIDYDDLAGYYPDAQLDVEVGPEPFSIDYWRPFLTEGAAPILEGDALETLVFRLSPPTRFGPRYRSELDAAATRVWLGATVRNLMVSPDGSGITGLEVVGADGSDSNVVGDVVVLATGGLEVPRLMLASRDANPAGVGNAHDVVGRYFMEHPHLELGAYLAADELLAFTVPIMYGVSAEVEGRTLLSHVSLTAEARAEHRLPALAASSTGPLDADDLPDLEAVSALVDDVEGGKGTGALGLFVRAEQRPSPTNRVTLTDEVDRLGVPRLRLHWEVDDVDRADYLRTMDLLAAEYGAQGYGRLHVNASGVDDFPDIGGGHHHMGTARMADDPTRGVVDANLKVHGVENLYVASSAVFPTSGAANPTLTIVALARRLATHLAGGAP